MTVGIDPKIYIGKQYGIYKIIALLPEKDKHNHYVYQGECQECGFVKEGTIYDFKNKNVQNCSHWSELTQEQKDAWYEKNKKQCLCCGEDIPFNARSPSEYKRQKFCNQKCAASFNNLNKNRYLKKRLEKNTEKNNIVLQEVLSKNYCKNCGKEIDSRKQFCNLKCLQRFQQNSYVQRWKEGLEDGRSGKYGISKRIKTYLFEKYDNKCSQCGWCEMNITTGKIPLEVHHKDGDYTNNSEDNLTLLWPNCHSLTPTYKAANIGNGRKDRKIYYKGNLK